MADFSPGYYKTIKIIDGFTERTGEVFAWLAVPLAIAVFWEVVSRYFFDLPTTWSCDLGYMLYGALFMLGSAYALRQGAHIRTDMLWEKFSESTKGKIDFYAYILFFYPGMILLFMTASTTPGSHSSTVRYPSKPPGAPISGRSRGWCR